MCTHESWLMSNPFVCAMPLVYSIILKGMWCFNGVDLCDWQMFGNWRRSNLLWIWKPVVEWINEVFLCKFSVQYQCNCAILFSWPASASTVHWPSNAFCIQNWKLCCQSDEIFIGFANVVLVQERDIKSLKKFCLMHLVASSLDIHEQNWSLYCTVLTIRNSSLVFSVQQI